MSYQPQRSQTDHRKVKPVSERSGSPQRSNQPQKGQTDQKEVKTTSVRSYRPSLHITSIHTPYGHSLFSCPQFVGSLGDHSHAPVNTAGEPLPQQQLSNVTVLQQQKTCSQSPSKLYNFDLKRYIYPLKYK